MGEELGDWGKFGNEVVLVLKGETFVVVRLVGADTGASEGVVFEYLLNFVGGSESELFVCLGEGF